jgi:hypothetical protein
MNLLFRQADQFSIYSEEVLINGKYKTRYIAEMFTHSGRYAIDETFSYFKALRMLAKFKNNL